MAKDQLSSPFKHARGISEVEAVPGRKNTMLSPFDKPKDSGPDTIPTVITDDSLAGHKPGDIVSTPMTKKE